MPSGGLPQLVPSGHLPVSAHLRAGPGCGVERAIVLSANVEDDADPRLLTCRQRRKLAGLHAELNTADQTDNQKECGYDCDFHSLITSLISCGSSWEVGR